MLPYKVYLGLKVWFKFKCLKNKNHDLWSSQSNGVTSEQGKRGVSQILQKLFGDKIIWGYLGKPRKNSLLVVRPLRGGGGLGPDHQGKGTLERKKNYLWPWKKKVPNDH